MRVSFPDDRDGKLDRVGRQDGARELVDEDRLDPWQASRVSPEHPGEFDRG